MLRELLRGNEYKAGTHSISWDGLDRLGKPVQPGTYEWKLLFTEGFPAELIVRLGYGLDGLELICAISSDQGLPGHFRWRLCLLA
ncbi:MAG: hypothetical protein EBE86_020935 [Hormoscilla sp. GUM202]|nr:hypothetical protein [Hormoscilla sp. GM7CHS1pb]MBO1349682.1 hypothetical protein [Hormoscilla sp. GUM202]